VFGFKKSAKVGIFRKTGKSFSPASALGKKPCNKICLQNNKNPKFEAPFIW
jgi:hypothetical protein